MVLILDDIFLSPISLVRWVGEKLHETAEGEITDESKVQEELLELQMCLELEQITEQQYDEKEKGLMDRLEAIRKYKEAKEGVN